MSGIIERTPLVRESERLFVQAERIPVAVDLMEHWVGTVKHEHLGSVTVEGTSLIKRPHELNVNSLTFRSEHMPEGLREKLAVGLRLEWHKALITYSDGTTELAESFRETS